MTEDFDTWEGEGGRIYVERVLMKNLRVSISHKLRSRAKGKEALTSREATGTKAQIASSLSKHNRKVRAEKNKFWCIPRVFGGMNNK